MYALEARMVGRGQVGIGFSRKCIGWLVMAVLLGVALLLSSMVLLSSVVAAPPEAPAADAAASLMAYWKFDEGSGIAVADSSGNANHGALLGDATWMRPPAPTGWANPWAILLDGAADYVEVPWSSTLNPGSELTMMAWVYLQHPEQTQKVVGCVASGLVGGYLLGIDKGQLDPEVWDSSGAHYRFQGGSIPAAQWTHVAVTWKSGGQMRGYVNGKQVAAIPASQNSIGQPGQALVMGAAPWNRNVFGVNGALDEVRLYNRELNAAEILAAASACAATPNNGADVYPTLQGAIDAAAPRAVVKVAGTCSGVQTRPILNTPTFTATQVAVITKSLSVFGGYTASNWATANIVANPTTLDAQGLGRVMLITGTITVTLHGLHITGGTATGLGGYKNIYGSAPSEAAGGGLYIWGAKADIAHCKIYSNTAWATREQGWYGYGAGIYLDHADRSLLEGNWIAHNVPRLSGYGYGGAVFATSSNNLTFLDNVIEANGGTTGNGFGGGLWLDHCNYTRVDANTIRNNTGSLGNWPVAGGGGAWVESSDYVTITSNIVTANSAGGAGRGGGGMYLSKVNHARIADNEFSDNVASLTGWSGGGGVHLLDCTDVSLTGNRFARNVAAPSATRDSWGGGAQITRGGFITLTNNVFLGNQATSAGSAVAISNTTALLLHTTFAGNYGGDGSALCVAASRSAGSSASLVNTILFSHTVGITVAQGSTVTLQATLWQGVGTMWTGAGVVSSSANHVGDARLATDGYHLQAGSAAIDRGVNAGVRTDIDGQQRPSGAGYDLGADEFWPVQFLPLILRNRLQ